MDKFKQYFKEFVNDESGMELLQFAVVVVITAGLIGAVMAIKNIVSGGLNGSKEQLIEGFGDADIQLDENGNYIPN